jgi:hypothetical protein
LIRVNLNQTEYAYIPRKSCWVTPANQIVLSPKKLEVLRQLAVDAGHTDVDFAKPPSDMDRYIKMLETEKEKSEPKKKVVKNPRLKSSSAVSLTAMLKKKE